MYEQAVERGIPRERAWLRFTRSHAALVIGLAVVGALVIRLALALLVDYLGHSDYVFYYTVGRNVAAGRGFEVDYIWNYLSDPDGLPYTSNDYWMPGAAAVIAAFLRVFGDSVFVGLVPSMLLGVAVAAPVAIWARDYTGAWFAGVAVVPLVLALPLMMGYSLMAHSTMYFVFCAVCSLVMMSKGGTQPRRYLLAAGLAGLAYLMRQDGLLLLAVLSAAVLASGHMPRTKARFLAGSVIVFLLVIAPWLVSTVREFGRPLPPGPSKTMFAREYEDIYTYSNALTLDSYLDWGVSNIARQKADMALNNGMRLQSLLWQGISRRTYDADRRTFTVGLGYALWGLVIAGIVVLLRSPERRARRDLYLPFVLHLELLFLFYTLVATAVSLSSAFERSALAIAPFLLVVMVDGLVHVVRSRAVAAVIVAVLTGILLAEGVRSTEDQIATQNRFGRMFERLTPVVAADAAARDQANVVIMTRDPWEVSFITGYAAIQVPNDDLDSILAAARRYDANYLLLPAQRAALDPLVDAPESDARFEYVGPVPESEMRVFYIRPAAE